MAPIPELPIFFTFDTTDGWQEHTKLTASAAGVGALAGLSVALHEEHTAAVGAPGATTDNGQTGSAFFYQLGSVGQWDLQTDISDSDFSQFGVSLSLDAGDSAGAVNVLVGASGDSAQGVNAGSAHLYEIAPDPLPEITTPMAETELEGQSQLFSWDENDYAGDITQWALFAGSAAGLGDFFIGGYDLNISGVVSGLPTGAQTVYLTLWWKDAGVWMNNGSIAYTAATVGPVYPTIDSPLPGSTLSSASTEFTWGANAFPGIVDSWAIYAGSTSGGFDYFIDGFGTQQTGTVTDLPIDGNDVYITLWWKDEGVWYNNGSDLFQTQ